MFNPNAQSVFQDGPNSDPFPPRKSDIRKLLTQYEEILNAVSASGGLVYASLSSLNADLAKAANTMAWVIGDATVANVGIYRKIGASGSGSWVRVADLPFSIIVASDTGTGTANAIEATTLFPVGTTSLVVLRVYRANTGSPVTVKFNGQLLTYTLKTNSGNDIAPGGLAAGMTIFGVIDNVSRTLRALNDQVSSAIVAAAEAAASAAASARDTAIAAAAGVTLPLAVNETFLFQPPGGGGYVTKTQMQVRQLLGFFEATNDISSATIAANLQRIQTRGYLAPGDGGACNLSRVASQPATGGFRSVDRYLPNGTVDATNGGWWRIDEAFPNECMFGGVVGQANSQRTQAIQDMFNYCVESLPYKRARIVRGHVITATITVPPNLIVDFGIRGTAGSSGSVSNLLDKGFNGTMMNLGSGAVLNNAALRGNAASWTGDGIVIDSGSDQLLNEPYIIDTAGACIRFPTGGQGIRFKCNGGILQASQEAGTNYAVVMPATEATTIGYRQFSGVHTGGTPFIDFKNGNYTLVDHCVFAGLNWGNTTTGRTKVTNCRNADALGNLIFGIEHTFALNTCSGGITLGSGAQYCKIVGNIIAGGGSPVDSSGNATNTIV